MQEHATPEPCWLSSAVNVSTMASASENKKTWISIFVVLTKCAYNENMATFFLPL